MTSDPRLSVYDAYDADLNVLRNNATVWAQTPVQDRIAVLNEVIARTAEVAEGWAEVAARKKLLPANSSLAGEEWIGGPYAFLAACQGLLNTLENMEDRAFLKPLKKRYLSNGQLAVRVMPNSIWDKLLFSGVHADVWMQPGVSETTLARHTASAYVVPLAEREGRVALVLGAGNISSIAPLDCLYKLYHEHQVVLLKMNPVNDYLTEYLMAALEPLVRCGAVRIVRGDGPAGAYLTQHPEVDEIHITGAAATHDAIVWGLGAEGAANKAAGTPKNARRITSELGAVCPVIVVPGPWSAADLQFQAEQIATMKLHNSGFNCVACQVLIMPGEWEKAASLMSRLKRVMSKNQRLAYYPGADERVNAFATAASVERVSRGDAPDLVIDTGVCAEHAAEEVFGPAMSVHNVAGEGEAYLKSAIAFANDRLHGTLGANILIHPATIAAMGKPRFEACLAELRYGVIAVNAWTGLAYGLAPVPWGAFPGHTPSDVGSGIGFVHNAMMFDRAERSVVYGPWAPFPRSIKEGGRSLLPKPPTFITHRTADKLGRAITQFAANPRWSKLPAILWHALRG